MILCPLGWSNNKGRSSLGPKALSVSVESEGALDLCFYCIFWYGDRLCRSLREKPRARRTAPYIGAAWLSIRFEASDSVFATPAFTAD